MSSEDGNKEIKQLHKMRETANEILQECLEIPRPDECVKLKIENALRVSDYVKRELSRIYKYYI